MYDTTTTTTTIYTTDASDFKEKPVAVCYPKHAEDIKKIIQHAQANKIKTIPRSA